MIKKRETGKCLWCGKEFKEGKCYSWPSYCSHQCYYDWVAATAYKREARTTEKKWPTINPWYRKTLKGFLKKRTRGKMKEYMVISHAGEDDWELNAENWQEAAKQVLTICGYTVITKEIYESGKVVIGNP